MPNGETRVPAGTARNLTRDRLLPSPATLRPKWPYSPAIISPLLV